MKYYQIAVFVFILNISIAMLNTTGAFPVQFQKQADQNFINESAKIAETTNVTGTQLSQGNDFLTAVGQFSKGMSLFITAFFGAPVVVGSMITDIFPDSPEVSYLSFLVTSIIWLIYLAGVVQFMANRAFRGMS